jgi:hypothetical protein
MLLLAVLTSVPSPSLRKGTAHQDKAPSQFEEYSYNPQRGTEGSPLIVQVKPQPTTDVEAAAIKKKESDDESAKRWGIFTVAIGIVVAIIQSVIFWRQLKVFDRQTKIQEAMMAQWIELGGWKWTENTPRQGMDISFDLINPTGFSLTLKDGEITFEVGDNPPLIIFVYRRIPLAPNKPLTIKSFVAFNELRTNAFRTGNVGMGVEGNITFINALKEEITQHFSGVLSHSGSETTYESAIKLSPPKDGTAQKAHG